MDLVWQRYLVRIRYSKPVTTNMPFLTLAIFTIIVKVVEIDWSFICGLIFNVIRHESHKHYPHISYILPSDSSTLGKTLHGRRALAS